MAFSFTGAAKVIMNDIYEKYQVIFDNADELDRDKLVRQIIRDVAQAVTLKKRHEVTIYLDSLVRLIRQVDQLHIEKINEAALALLFFDALRLA